MENWLIKINVIILDGVYRIVLFYVFIIGNG